MVLLINACARRESRTLPLARAAARKLSPVTETLNLYDQQISPLTGEALAKREEYCSRGDFSDGMFRFAKQFREADRIVIAAPYWDLSFPAILKCYTEAVCVNGLTFRYGEDGIPEGLCRADKLVYVTTAGGFIPDGNFGYDYIRQLCAGFFGIRDTVCIKAEGLDIRGADVGAILREAGRQMDALLS